MIPLRIREPRYTLQLVRNLPTFFANSTPNKACPDLRDRIHFCQDECGEVLWNYGTKGQTTWKGRIYSPLRHRQKHVA